MRVHGSLNLFMGFFCCVFFFGLCNSLFFLFSIWILPHIVLFTVQLFLSLNTVSHRASPYFGESCSLKVTEQHEKIRWGGGDYALLPRVRNWSLPEVSNSSRDEPPPSPSTILSRCWARGVRITRDKVSRPCVEHRLACGSLRLASRNLSKAATVKSKRFQCELKGTPH